MKRSLPFLLALVGIAVWLSGCTVSEKGTPFANQPPVTTLTVAPQENDTVNHYITLRWSGADPDGDVVAFRVTVDDTSQVVTTSHDTTIAFAAPENGGVVHHSVSVAAVDNEGLIGATVTRSFFTINYAPAAQFVESGSVHNNSEVGIEFRMTLKSSDPNPSRATFCIRVDSAEWTCSRDSVFLFGSRTLHKRESDVTLVGVDDDHDGAIDEEEENGIDDDHDGRVDEDTRGLIATGSTVVDNQPLQTVGPHTIYAQVIDAGGAVSSIISRTINVVDIAQAPLMDATVAGTYSGNDLYPDGSIYFSRNADTRLVFHAVAGLQGEINAYRHQYGDSAWSDWHTSPEVVFSDLPVGDYILRSVARDLAGVVSDTAFKELHIVRQNLTANIVIVDETRNGNGQRGSPDDAQVDAFYDALFAGLNTTQVDYSVQNYVSPLNLRDAGVVMWHADDKAELKLADNLRLLNEYLDRGGRVILSGWDLLGGTLSNSQDSVFFLQSSFMYTKLHSEYAVRNTSRTATGFTGDNGYPGCQIDSAKVPSSWAGTIDKTWTFRPRGEEIVVGRLTVNNPDVNPLSGRPTAYIYDLSFRVAVFGVPLYFCYQDQVYNLFRNPNGDPNFIGIVDQMLAGL